MNKIVELQPRIACALYTRVVSVTDRWTAALARRAANALVVSTIAITLRKK